MAAGRLGASLAGGLELSEGRGAAGGGSEGKAALLCRMFCRGNFWSEYGFGPRYSEPVHEEEPIWSTLPPCRKHVCSACLQLETPCLWCYQHELVLAALSQQGQFLLS